MRATKKTEATVERIRKLVGDDIEIAYFVDPKETRGGRGLYDGADIYVPSLEDRVTVRRDGSVSVVHDWMKGKWKV